VPEPAPARRSERAFAAIAYAGFNLSLLISAALLLGVLALDSQAAWLNWSKLVLGVALAGEGFLLALDWRGARRLTLWRIRRWRSAGRERDMSLSKRIGWKLASPVLELLGIGWILVGLLAAGLGLTAIV
jgi:hypothetical protein